VLNFNLYIFTYYILWAKKYSEISSVAIESRVSRYNICLRNFSTLSKQMIDFTYVIST
jgi:hypothetical protein